MIARCAWLARSLSNELWRLFEEPPEDETDERDFADPPMYGGAD